MKHLKKTSLFPKLFYLLFVVYFVFLWNQQFFSTPEGVNSGWIGSWADGSAHLTYASAFAYGPGLSGGLPIYKGHPFTYSFAADFFTSLLTRVGIDVYTAHKILGLVLSLTLTLLLTLFYSQITRSQTATLIGTFIFFTSGGLGWFWFLKDLINNPNPNTLLHLPRQYTHLPNHGIEWINTVTGLLIPQRSLLLALNLGLVLLIITHKIIQTQTKPKPWTQIILGSILGLLPIVQPHAFIVFCFFYFWLIFVKKEIHLNHFFFIPAILISAICFYFFIFPSLSSSFASIKPGWMASNSQTNWIIFWLKNWGAFLPLSLFVYYFQNKERKILTTPFFLLFLLANVVIFQPYDWDNVKIFIWIYLIFSPLVALFLVKLFSQHKVVTILLFFTLTLSGTLDIIRVLDLEQNQQQIFSNEERQLAQFVRNHTKPQDVFLTAPLHNHFVPTLTGRTIILGYLGWINTYGIDYQNRYEKVKAIYRGDPQASLLIDYYDIDYLVLGWPEKWLLHTNQEFFEKNFPKLISTPNYTIYKTSR